MIIYLDQIIKFVSSYMLNHRLAGFLFLNRKSKDSVVSQDNVTDDSDSDSVEMEKVFIFINFIPNKMPQ